MHPIKGTSPGRRGPQWACWRGRDP